MRKCLRTCNHTWNIINQEWILPICSTVRRRYILWFHFNGVGKRSRQDVGIFTISPTVFKLNLGLCDQSARHSCDQNTRHSCGCKFNITGDIIVHVVFGIYSRSRFKITMKSWRNVFSILVADILLYWTSRHLVIKRLGSVCLCLFVFD